MARDLERPDSELRIAAFRLSTMTMARLDGLSRPEPIDPDVEANWPGDAAATYRLGSFARSGIPPRDAWLGAAAFSRAMAS